LGIAGGGTTQQSKMAQSMVDVMSLPMMAAGGTILSATTKYMQSLGGEGANISPEIQRVARPIAETFGLPPSIVNKAKQGSTSKPSGVGKPGEEGGEPSKNIFAKLMDGFGAMLDKMKDSINTTPPTPPGDDNFNNNSPVADVSKDTEFISEVHKLAGETGTTPSELMSMYNAESKLDPKARNASGATGLFQLMFDPDDPNDKRYGKTRDEFSALSRADQVRAHRKYLTEAKFFEKGGSGLADVKTANIAPAFLGEPSDTPMYRKGSVAYERNKNVDIMYGNNDGVLDANDYAAFVKKTGQEEKFRKYNDPSYATAQPTPPPNPSPTGQLGQAITNNYGLGVGKERKFTVPGYGEVTAHKTTVGFDFFKDGRILDVSPSNPQGKTIVDHFKKTNGGQTISPPEEKIVSSLSPQNNSESGNIAVLNIGGGGGSPTSNSGSVSQPSGEDGTQRGIHPLGPFGFNSISIGVG